MQSGEREQTSRAREQKTHLCRSMTTTRCEDGSVSLRSLAALAPVVWSAKRGRGRCKEGGQLGGEKVESSESGLVGERGTCVAAAEDEHVAHSVSTRCDHLSPLRCV